MNLWASRIQDLWDDYRESWSTIKVLSFLKRMSLLTSAGGVRVFDILFYKYLSMFLQKQEIGSEVPFSEVLNTEKYEAALSQIANHKIKLSYAPLSDLALDLDNEWKLYLYQKRYEEIGRIIGDQAEEK